MAPGTGESGRTLATRARKLLSERVASRPGTANFPVLAPPPLDHDELQRHADRQLYANKHGDDKHFAARTAQSGRRRCARVVDAPGMATPIEHSTIVARYASRDRGAPRVDGQDLAHVRIAAMLHDIGKVVLRTRILQKPETLNHNEYEEVKRHPEAGAELINRVEGLSQIADRIGHSHERFNGSGRPHGLAGARDAARVAPVWCGGAVLTLSTSDRRCAAGGTHERRARRACASAPTGRVQPAQPW